MFIPNAKKAKESIAESVESTSKYESTIREIFDMIKDHYYCHVSYLDLKAKHKLEHKDVEKIMIYFDYKEYVVTRLFSPNEIAMGFKISLLE